MLTHRGGVALRIPGAGKVKPKGGDVLDAGGNHAEDTGIAGFWRRPSTNEMWTGRGKPPKWLAAEIAAGKTREDFLVQS
jgi:hypothetical protein